jgi:hypothetical protein
MAVPDEKPTLRLRLDGSLNEGGIHVCARFKQKSCPCGQHKNPPVLSYRRGREVLVLYLVRPFGQLRKFPCVVTFREETRRWEASTI